jgi:hypothetical protein
MSHLAWRKLLGRPVQAPTRYGMVINLEIAKALGPKSPTSCSALADEVIE